MVGVRSWPIRFKFYRRRRCRATTATASGGTTARGYIIKTVKRRPVGRALVAAFMVLYPRAFGCWLHCFNNNNILLVRGGGNHYYFYYCFVHRGRVRRWKPCDGDSLNGGGGSSSYRSSSTTHGRFSPSRSFGLPSPVHSVSLTRTRSHSHRCRLTIVRPSHLFRYGTLSPPRARPTVSLVAIAARPPFTDIHRPYYHSTATHPFSVSISVSLARHLSTRLFPPYHHLLTTDVCMVVVVVRRACSSSKLL